MTITLRIDKGSPLTIEELDGNFVDLDGRVVVLEDGQTTYRSIEEITQSGNSLTVVYTDSTTDGPFTFEVLITYRGDWAASTSYAQNDLVRATGVIYLVATSHVSDVTFDPGATYSDGDIYIPFLEMPELSIPVGGGEGYVLAKASDDDHDMEWQNRGVPTGGSTGEVLIKTGAEDFECDWGVTTAAPIATVATTTFTLSEIYSGAYIRCTHLSGCTITIPVNSSVEFEVGTEIHFRQSNAGPLDIVAEEVTGGEFVQINGIDGHEFGTDTDGAVATIKKINTNEWDLFGLLRTGSS